MNQPFQIQLHVSRHPTEGCVWIFGVALRCSCYVHTPSDLDNITPTYVDVYVYQNPTP